MRVSPTAFQKRRETPVTAVPEVRDIEGPGRSKTRRCWTCGGGRSRRGPAHPASEQVAADGRRTPPTGVPPPRMATPGPRAARASASSSPRGRCSSAAPRHPSGERHEAQPHGPLAGQLRREQVPVGGHTGAGAVAGYGFGAGAGRSRAASGSWRSAPSAGGRHRASAARRLNVTVTVSPAVPVARGAPSWPNLTTSVPATGPATLTGHPGPSGGDISKGGWGPGPAEVSMV